MGRSPAPKARRLAGILTATAIALAAPAATPASETETSVPAQLVFARHGATVATLDVAELREIAATTTVRVFDPYEGGEVPFAAVPLRAVLDAVYTPAWREEEELLFSCRDGYQPTLPTGRAVTHDAFLAFARRDRDDFAIRKRESGRVQSIELAPFYLVWRNLGNDALIRDGDYGWPYQLVGIDLIRAADRFPEMAPPPDAPDEVVAGFRAFRVHCSRCHTVNGEGGQIGPELNRPVNPLDHRDAAWLRRWIDDPAAILPDARMPRLNPALPERERVIDALIAYLDAMRATRAQAAEGGTTTDGG